MPELSELIQFVGYIGLFAIIFAESGLFIGFFLPGDSLLFTAGILASQGHLEIIPLVLVCVAAATTGDSFGYWFGARVGPALFKREDSWLFHRKHLIQAKQFFAKHGGMTLILARFTPIVRTFAPILAGVGKMPYVTFVSYNVIGGCIWGVGIPLLGYYLGASVPHIDRYLMVIIGTIIVLSIIPPIVHLIQARRTPSHEEIA